MDLIISRQILDEIKDGMGQMEGAEGGDLVNREWREETLRLMEVRNLVESASIDFLG